MVGDDAEAPPTMLDRWGYPVRTGSADCIAAVDAYYEQFLSFGRERSVILRAVEADPGCVLANTLAAHLLASKDRDKASALLSSAAASLESATSFEKAVYGAISCLVTNDENDDDLVLDLHFQLVKEFPKDLVSTKRAQVLCFYMGRPDLSLNFVEQVLAHNEGESYIYGMLSFALLELGRMTEAEKAARKGLDINKFDIWSQHNLCHVYQYHCRFKEAVDMMEAFSQTWGSCSSFIYTHNWWHVALCYLEGNSPVDRVLELYDLYIWKEIQRSAEPGECFQVYTNALGLLLRFHVRGQMAIIEDRLISLAELLKDKRTWHAEWFLDILALWALSITKETRRAADLLESMKSRFNLMNKKKQLNMQRGVLLAEAIFEFGCGNYQRAFDILSPDFDATNFRMIGASDEQIDVFNDAWYIILLNVGQTTQAIQDISKGLSKRQGSSFLWRLLEKAYKMEGSSDDAQFAAEKAKALECAFFK